MRKYIGKYILLFVICLAVGLSVYFFIASSNQRSEGQRQTLMNRVANEVSLNDISDIDNTLSALVKNNNWAVEYGMGNVPSDIVFIKADNAGGSYAQLGNGSSVWSLSKDGAIYGFLIFTFKEASVTKTVAVCETIVAACFIISVVFFIYIDRKVIMPFNRLSDYPERIAKNENADALPESKNKYFGKYIWGMNMLRDRLSGDTRKLRQLEKEQLTLVSTIAHGIKTPVANIKLYSEAIKSGLYRDGGVPDPKDSEVADKITRNADDITDLVKELLESASKGVVVFEPKVTSFYLTEIEEFIKLEYDNRLNVLRIPYKIDMKSRVMINSDKDGIKRILVQLLDNAIKYSDGRGITVTIDKNEDGYVFSVKDTGSRISESEMPYVFNSFWRGSNAGEVEGNGLGLYEAQFIAGKLGGDITVRYLEETEETEFEVFLPL